MDLNNCVIDVSSRCDLSLAARDTVEPAVEKLTDKSQLDLSLVAHRVACLHDVNPFDRMNDATDSTTGADRMRPASRVPEGRLHRIGAASSLLEAALFFFHACVSPCDPMFCSLSSTVC